MVGDDGGGLSLVNYGTATITGTTISGNASSNYGGGVHATGNLAIAPDGSVWAAIWPERGQIVRLRKGMEPELMLQFDVARCFAMIGASTVAALDRSHVRIHRR